MNEFLQLTTEDEKDKYWDKFYKERVNDIVLITNNPKVLTAYKRMTTRKNTDYLFTENDYINQSNKISMKHIDKLKCKEGFIN